MAEATIAYEERAIHAFFISYWRRSNKREALIWAKNEQAATGMLLSAVPEADIRTVEQREAGGAPRGRNVYVMRGDDRAEEYFAVDSRGQKVFGPTNDYQQARMHADRAGGVVKFEMDSAAEGPHSIPRLTLSTKDDAIRVAQQVPGGPWAYVKSYPREAQARIERQQDFTIDGETVTAYFCGRHLLLRSAEAQYLFEGSCIGDAPKRPAGPQGVLPEKGKPFIVRFKRDEKTLVELGPFETPTEAMTQITKHKGSQRDDLAAILRDGKVIEFRGSKAAFVFGRTRWSRV